ncbi:hypothetical protein ACVMHZ_000551 [Bradyrhizobium liaoningense]
MPVLMSVLMHGTSVPRVVKSTRVSRSSRPPKRGGVVVPLSVDKRYREFAAAFSFAGGTTPVAQSEHQTDEMIGLYTATKKSQVDALADDSKYYSAHIGSITSADQLLNDDRLRNYVYSAYGIDQSKWPRDTISQVLRSDPSDPNSYVNTTFASQLNGLKAQLAQAQSDVSAANSKIADYTAQLSQPGANVTQLKVQILVEKHHLESYATNISSLSDQIATINGFVDLAGAFEFSPDGSLPSGVSAQTAANVTITKQRFDDSKAAVYSAASPLNEAFAIRQFRTALLTVNSVDAFISTPDVYVFALGAVGLDPKEVSQATIKAVLESDLSDPKSYVHTLKDDRYVQLARAFNFDAKGNLTTPLVAQDAAEVLEITRDYVISAVKSASTASPQQQAAVRAQATKDATDYQEAIAGIDSVSDLLANRPMVDFILLAKGLDPRKGQHRFSQENLRLQPERSKELCEHAERSPLCRHRGVVQLRQQGQRRAPPDDGSPAARSISGNPGELSPAKPGAAARGHESRRAPGALLPAKGGRHHVGIRHPRRQGAFGGVQDHLQFA